MLLVLLLLVLFLLVLLGFYVFVASPRNRTHQTFTAFVLCLALWTVKDIALWGFSARDGSAQWWASSSFVIALALQYSLIIIAWVFPQQRAVPPTRAADLFAPAVVFVTPTLAGLSWRDA